jgi:hypothetical protein
MRLRVLVVSFAISDRRPNAFALPPSSGHLLGHATQHPLPHPTPRSFVPVREQWPVRPSHRPHRTVPDRRR